MMMMIMSWDESVAATFSRGGGGARRRHLAWLTAAVATVPHGALALTRPDPDRSVTSTPAALPPPLSNLCRVTDE